MSDANLSRWQNITLATLFTGYTGYYICRSNLSVATPLIIESFGHLGDPKAVQVMIGDVASVGTFWYAVGKFSNGLFADYLGGRTMFLLGMFVSVLCTVLFGLAGGFGVFAVVWGFNRYFQSMGWVSMVKLTSHWFPVYRHASVMGILSMSYLIGDAIARAFLGQVISLGADWRTVFFVSAGTLGTMSVVSLFTLKASPTKIGAEEPTANPLNVYGEEGHTAKPGHPLKLMLPLLKSFAFWVICIISFGLTFIRETFGLWTPLYLTENTDLDPGQAAIGSLLFPLVGALSVFLAGNLSDRLGRKHGRVVVPSMMLLVFSLFLLGRVDVAGNWILALTLISLVSFFLLAPYSYLAGLMALDLGGKRGSSTASGLIDSVGYFGGIVAGSGVSRLERDYNWNVVFGVLTLVSIATTAAAMIYWLHHEYTDRKLSQPAPEEA